MIIEIAGQPGAGKSSVARSVVALLRADGGFAFGADEAVLACVRRSLPGRIVLGLLGSAGEGRARRLVVDLPGSLATLGRHPLLAARVLRSVAASPLPFAHRRVLLTRFFVAAARDGFLRRHLAHHETAVVDEGLVHRVVNTFAWRSAEPGRAEVTAYLRAIAVPDLVVFVTAGAEVRDDRLRTRGLPVRLRGRPAAEAGAFLDRAGRLLDVAASVMPSRVRTVTVDNEGSVDDAGREIAAIADRAVEGAEPIDRGTRWPADFPRPDRAVARLRATRSAESESAVASGREAIEAVLASLGLVPTGRPRSVAAGRSRTFLVATDRGLVIVKRYKNSIDDAAIANEHAVLLHLQRQGVAAPRLVVAPGSSTSSIRMADGRYAAFEYLPGRHPAHDRFVPSRRRVAGIGGSVLGGLHAALADFRPPSDASTGLDRDGRRVRDAAWHATRVAEAMERRLGGDDELRQGAARMVTRIGELEALLLATRLPTATIHGDFGPYNLLVRRGKPAIPIDFELARLDWRVVDVVTALPRFSTGRLGRSRGAEAAFLRSYRDRCDMTAAEVETMPAVATYLALRRAVVLWSRATSSNHVAEAAGWAARAAVADPGQAP